MRCQKTIHSTFWMRTVRVLPFLAKHKYWCRISCLLLFFILFLTFHVMSIRFNLRSATVMNITISANGYLKITNVGTFSAVPCCQILPCWTSWTGSKQAGVCTACLPNWRQTAPLCSFLWRDCTCGQLCERADQIVIHKVGCRMISCS